MIYIIIETYYSHHGISTISEPKYLSRDQVPYFMLEKLNGEKITEKKYKYFTVHIIVFTSFLDAKKYREKLCA